MPTKRRSISIKGHVYQRLKAHAEKNGESISAYTESIINERLDRLGVRTFTEEEAEELRPKNGGKRIKKTSEAQVREQEQALEEGRGSGVHLL